MGAGDVAPVARQGDGGQELDVFVGDNVRVVALDRCKSGIDRKSLLQLLGDLINRHRRLGRLLAALGLGNQLAHRFHSRVRIALKELLERFSHRKKAAEDVGDQEEGEGNPSGKARCEFLEGESKAQSKATCQGEDQLRIGA